MTQLEKRLSRQGAFLMLTHGEGFSDDAGNTVPRRVAHGIVGDLFEKEIADLRTRGGFRMIANDDGLFPGHSQTWVYAK